MESLPGRRKRRLVWGGRHTGKRNAHLQAQLSPAKLLADYTTGTRSQDCTILQQFSQIDALWRGKGVKGVKGKDRGVDKGRLTYEWERQKEQEKRRCYEVVGKGKMKQWGREKLSCLTQVSPGFLLVKSRMQNNHKKTRVQIFRIPTKDKNRIQCTYCHII